MICAKLIARVTIELLPRQYLHVASRKLAEKLDTELGKRVVLMSQDPDNEIADRGFRVVGLFEANLELHEETYVFAGKATLQKMLGIEDQVTEVAVLAADYRNVNDETEQVRALMTGDVEVPPCLISRVT